MKVDIVLQDHTVNVDLDVPIINVQQSTRSTINVMTGAGPRGMTGMSAYDLAVKHGLDDTVTEHEWVVSLKGDPGYSPIRGADYWTAADIEAVVHETVDRVLAVYPSAEEVKY